LVCITDYDFRGDGSLLKPVPIVQEKLPGANFAFRSRITNAFVVECQDKGAAPETPEIGCTVSFHSAGSISDVERQGTAQNPITPQGQETGMEIRIEPKSLRDVVVLVPDIFQDSRGFFMETYREDQFQAFGLPMHFVQDNHSRSAKGVVRGLHFQWAPPMGKLMRVSQGSAFLVAVDIRKGSPTLGRWVGIEASFENRRQVWAPAGFARGFCVLSDFAEIQYKCTGIYNGKAESGILWNDPEIGIDWPVAATEAVLSDKDRKAQTLAQWLASPDSANFQY
jgi:dTDP-4-dehydrorhamnose 3,5-epimerase